MKTQEKVNEMTEPIMRIPKKKSIIGKVYGQLTVVDFTELKDKRGDIYYYFLCSCGAHRNATSDSLKRVISQDVKNAHMNINKSYLRSIVK